MNILKRAFHVSNDSIRFVFSNLEALKKHMSVIFPLFLVAAFANHYAVVYKKEWAMLALLFVLGYCVSCFFLTWHRVSLRGLDEKPHSPFDLSKGVLKFHFMFFGIFIVLNAINRTMTYLSENPAYIDANLLMAFGSIVPAIIGFVLLFRLMFFLPAQSVGVSLTLKETMKASKGEFGTFLLSSLFLGFAMLVAITIYSVIMASINMFMIGNAHLSQNAVAGISFVLAIPIYAIMFLYAAVEVTALSKLYQHGMQNNA